jgi:Mce-associated membrane protein
LSDLFGDGGVGAPADRLSEEPPAPRGRWVRALAFLAVVFFVGAVVMAVVAANLSSQLDDERGDRRGVERTASQLAARLLTYDYRKLDAARAGVLELATGTFRREYDEAFAGLKELLNTTKAVSVGDVTDVFVGDLSDDGATAIVVVNTTAEGVSGRRRTFASYIQLDLVRTQGRWLVDGVTNLNFGQVAPDEQSPGTAPTSSTTPTTAPPG